VSWSDWVSFALERRFAYCWVRSWVVERGDGNDVRVAVECHPADRARVEAWLTYMEQWKPAAVRFAASVTDNPTCERVLQVAQPRATLQGDGTPEKSAIRMQAALLRMELAVRWLFDDYGVVEAGVAGSSWPRVIMHGVTPSGGPGRRMLVLPEEESTDPRVLAGFTDDEVTWLGHRPGTWQPLARGAGAPIGRTGVTTTTCSALSRPAEGNELRDRGGLLPAGQSVGHDARGHTGTPQVTTSIISALARLPDNSIVGVTCGHHWPSVDIALECTSSGSATGAPAAAMDRERWVQTPEGAVIRDVAYVNPNSVGISERSHGFALAQTMDGVGVADVLACPWPAGGSSGYMVPLVEVCEPIRPAWSADSADGVWPAVGASGFHLHIDRSHYMALRGRQVDVAHHPLGLVGRARLHKTRGVGDLGACVTQWLHALSQWDRCYAVHGVSGSPVVHSATGAVLGLAVAIDTFTNWLLVTPLSHAEAQIKSLLRVPTVRWLADAVPARESLHGAALASVPTPCTLRLPTALKRALGATSPRWPSSGAWTGETVCHTPAAAARSTIQTSPCMTAAADPATAGASADTDHCTAAVSMGADMAHGGEGTPGTGEPASVPAVVASGGVVVVL